MLRIFKNSVFTSEFMHETGEKNALYRERVVDNPISALSIAITSITNLPFRLTPSRLPGNGKKTLYKQAKK